jgi:bilin biosynthesis protein
MRILLYTILILFACAVSACSTKDLEGYAEDLMKRFKIGSAGYMADLKSTNIMVKKNAIYYLGQKKSKKAVPHLIDLADSDQPKVIRLNAIMALGKIGEASAAEALIRCLDEGDIEIRTAAVCALGQMKDPKGVEPRLGVIHDQRLQLTVIWALGNMGEEAAVPVLTGLLASDDRFVRYNAGRALKKIGDLD